MADNHESRGMLGVILGALVAVAAALFLLGGGEYFGKKTVESDKDMPPIAQGVPGAAPPPETTGGGPTAPPPRRIVVPPPAR